ncbi:MAG: hypothetical protein HC769_31500 [Cyanobacteria bacterium CRU_2_1]|nr:hypothetical protein [Cyanobacteria bacterium CRU_2_1]
MTGKLRSDGDEFWLRFPGDPGQSLITRKNKALQLKNELLACDSFTALQVVKQRWSVDGDNGDGWVKTVYNRVLTVGEQSKVMSLCNDLGSQTNLLDRSEPSQTEADDQTEEWETVEQITDAYGF